MASPYNSLGNWGALTNPNLYSSYNPADNYGSNPAAMAAAGKLPPNAFKSSSLYSSPYVAPPSMLTPGGYDVPEMPQSDIADAVLAPNALEADGLFGAPYNPGNTGILGSLPTGNAGPGLWGKSMDWLFGAGTKESPGNAGTLMGLGTSLLGAYTSLGQYNLAKDKLAFDQKSYNENFGMQAGMTLSQLQGQQHARDAANPGAYNKLNAQNAPLLASLASYANRGRG